MYEITKAVSKFYDELLDENFEPELALNLTSKYADALIASYGEFNNLQAEVSEDPNESDEDEEVGSIGTVYIDLKPRVDGFIDALKKLNED